MTPLIRRLMPAEAAKAWSRAALFRATLMTLLAGFVDAVGYAAMGHLYLSFMSGNSTQLGMAIERLDRITIFWAGAVIFSFVAGAFIGSVLYNSAGRRKTEILLVCEFVCLMFAWSFSETEVAKFALLAITLAMGMQNSIHQNIAGASVGKSFITGALYGLGDALARACLKGGRFSEAAAFAASWLAFVTGVVIGAFAVTTFNLPCAILIGAAIVIALLILSVCADDRNARVSG